MVGGTNEEKPTGGHQGPAVILASRVANTFRHELRKLSERDLPGDFAAIQIDGVERAPGRRDSRVAVGVEKLIVAIVGVFQPM